MGGQVPQAPMK